MTPDDSEDKNHILAQSRPLDQEIISSKFDNRLRP